MDVTLQQYLALTPEAAIQTVQTLIDTTRNAGGAFMTLWHNSSLSEDGAWKNWRKVYEQILNYATK
jgi:ABC-type thiamine transport system substrate-binding protein